MFFDVVSENSSPFRKDTVSSPENIHLHKLFYNMFIAPWESFYEHLVQATDSQELKEKVYTLKI